MFTFTIKEIYSVCFILFILFAIEKQNFYIEGLLDKVRFDREILCKSQKIYKINQLHAVCPPHSRVGGSLVLRHSVSHFPPNYMLSFALRVEWRNSTPLFASTPMRRKEMLNPQPSRYSHTLVTSGP